MAIRSLKQVKEMANVAETPFESIESAQEYMGLLSQVIVEGKLSLQTDIVQCKNSRQALPPCAKDCSLQHRKTRAAHQS